MRKYRIVGTALIAIAFVAAASTRSGPTSHALSFAAETDFSTFRHDNPKHARLPCRLCHQRTADSVQPTLPGKDKHAPCSGCHAQLFANGPGPICTICHADVQAGTVKPFPPLRSFGARFDHALHVNRGTRCNSCHQPLNRGVALTIPSGVSAHNACFRCHTAQAKTADGRDISSCGVCHRRELLVRTSTQSIAYRRGFSHARHNNSASLSCTACHTVRASGSPKEITAPTALNHHAPSRSFSCLSCHNGKRAFGGDDFSACTRCHKGSSWRF